MSVRGEQQDGAPARQAVAQTVSQSGPGIVSAARGAVPPAPAALQAANFAAYPLEARALATANLALLRTIPLPLLPILLREIAGYDYRFPIERLRLERQLVWLSGLAPAQRVALLAPFAALRLSPALGRVDWIRDPATYMEQLTAELWSTGEMAAFRSASSAYAERMAGAVPEVVPVRPRLCVVVLDETLRGKQGAGAEFARLRSHGVWLTGLKPEDGFAGLLEQVRARSVRAQPFAHWYVDGGEATLASGAVATTSYAALEPVRQALLARAQRVMSQEKSGPEELRSLMAALRPEDLGFDAGKDRVLTHFELALMAEGSGTQVFATTFAQWAVREVLRRAEPETLLVRFRARQRQQGMNELMSGAASLGPDFAGSLLDAEQGAYYTWLNLQRLPGANQALFVAWQAGAKEAVAIGPGLPAGSTSHVAKTLAEAVKSLG